MSNFIVVAYRLSEETRNKIAAQTGKLLPEDNQTALNLENMTEAQRALVMRSARISWRGNANLVLKAKTIVREIYLNEEIAYLDEIPTAESLCAWLEQSDARESIVLERLAQAKAAHIQDHVDYIRAAIEEQDIKFGDGFRYLKDHESDAGYAEAALVAEEYNRLVVQWKAAARAKREDEKQAEHSHMSAWIAKRGSAHLKRAFAAGYDCLRRYVVERARIEFPSAEIDTEDTAAWDSRPCPSDAALDLAEAWLKMYPAARVVWLKAAPSCRVDPKDFVEDDDGETGSFEPCEAVVIEKYLDAKWDLVQVV